MLGVTDSAVKELKKIILDSNAEGSGVRVFASQGCCGPSYGFDLTEKGNDGDKLLEKDGLKIFIDPVASNGLDSATIDFLEEGLHKGFLIQGLPESNGCSDSGCSDGGCCC
jgi:iron-sulfur cluster assembly protein